MMVWARISNLGLLVRLWLGRRLGLSDLASGSGMDGAGLRDRQLGSGLAAWLAGTAVAWMTAWRVGSRDDCLSF